MNNLHEQAMSIQEFLEQDHERLDSLLTQALNEDGQIDQASFDEFRKGLLKHIGIEEKLLFPEAISGGTLDEKGIAATLRLHHGAIASLLVIEPSASSIHALRYVLAIHNPIEESLDGFYATCEGLAGDSAPEMLSRMRLMPEVPVATRAQNTKVIESARRSLVRAGFPASFLE